MMKTRYKIALTLLLLGMNNPMQAFAHSVWMEPDAGDKLVIRFGEFDEDYESSPGYLDSLHGMVAWASSDTEPVLLTPLKKESGFHLEATSKDSVQAQAGFPIMTGGSNPGRKPYFYARWTHDVGEASKPALTLDIVPTGTKGEVRVLFRNQPLAGVTATVFTPEANDKELKSDDHGILRFDINEKGLYMVKVGRYREERVGFDQGSMFEWVSHNCSLTWIEK